MLSFCGCSSLRRAKKKSGLLTGKKELKLNPNPQLSNEQPFEALPTFTSISEEPGDLNLDDFGIQDVSHSKAKSSGTLDTVKSKLIRHLSYDKDSHHPSPASPSNNEEEIARRAELRRFRAKRIQEELNADHTKSVSAHTSIRSTKYLSPLIDIGLPGQGPRDAIEFSIDSSNHLLAPCPSPAPGPSSSSFRTQGALMRRWSSCPAGIGSISNEFTANLDGIIRPSSASLHGSLLRAKSQQSASFQPAIKSTRPNPQSGMVRGKDSLKDSRSALGVWLVAQDMRSFNRPTRDINKLGPAKTKSHRHPNSIVGEIGVDGAIKVPYPVWCPDTSRRRASVPRNMVEQKSSSRVATSRPMSRNRSRQSILMVPSKFTNNSSSASSQPQVVPSTTPGGISSSYYPSVMPSIQPSPCRSNSLVNVLSMRDLQNLELSPFTWHDDSSIFQNFGTSGDLSSYVTADEGDLDTQEHSDNDNIETINRRALRDSQPSTTNHSRRNDGQEGKESTLRGRFAEALKIPKRRTKDNNSLQQKVSASSSHRNSTDREKARSNLPQLWRATSDSLNVQDSLPKRPSSKFWHQSRTSQLPQTDIVTTKNPISSINSAMDAINSPAVFSRDRPVTNKNKRATLRKGQHEAPASTRQDVNNSIGTFQASDSPEQTYTSSRSSVAYHSLQEISRRNVSAPPLSWARQQSSMYKQHNSFSRSGGSGKTAQYSPLVYEQSQHTDLNRESRSSSFPTKLSNMIRTSFVKIVSQQSSTDDLTTPNQEPVRSQILTLQPLEIDTAQTSPVLGEMGIFYPARDDSTPK